jgi:hypothetical protein
MNQHPGMFQAITDPHIAATIAQAQQRLVFMAPGVSEAVSAALVTKIAQGNCPQVALILDGDEECCRLGYSHAGALQKLHQVATQHGTAIRRQPGLRLCLLMADEQLLIWTPTPLMFEAPPEAAQPNGLVLSPTTLNDLPAAVVQGTSGKSATVGAAKLQAAEVAEVVAAIRAAPPAPFDLSRLARVFSSKFQFIETTLRGAELTKREMRLDSLILNVDAPEELRPLLHTTIQPFNSDADKTVDVPVLINGEQAFRANGEPHMKATKQADIHAYWNELTGRYIINMPGFGKIIRQADKAKFEAERVAFEEVLKLWVTGFKKQVEGDHDSRVKRVVDLIDMRMGSLPVKDRMPRHAVESLVKKGLENLRVIDPSVKVIYKNFTVESTKDGEFVEALKKVVPKGELTDWFSVFDAAPAVQLKR